MEINHNVKSKKEIIASSWTLLLWTGITISLYINLGKQPLRMEEPRRALVALEIDLNQNWVVPTIYGEYYYKKPPVWNWMILFSTKIWGSYSEWAIRFFSPFSLLFMGLIMFFLGKRYVHEDFAHLSALLFLVSIDLFLFYSQLAEIDLFYSLITFTSIVSIFYFGPRGQYWKLFMVSYFLTAMGFLTKGLPSLAFQGISLLTFCIYYQQLDKLFTLRHLNGIGIFFLVIAGFFVLYDQDNSPMGFLETLWSESSDRTALSKGIQSFFVNLVVFPVEFLKNILPASLFVPFLFHKKVWKRIHQNPFMRFSFFMLISNILIYWFSPGTRQRYVYMLYPFMIYLLVFAYLEYREEKPEIEKVIHYIWGGILLIAALGCLALPFIPELKPLSHILWVSIIFSLLLGGLFFIHVRFPAYRTAVFITALILSRVIIDLTMFPARSLAESDTQMEKDQALEVARQTTDRPLYLYQNVALPLRMGFYLTREKQQILNIKHEIDTSAYFIVDEYQLSNLQVTPKMEFTDKNQRKFYVIEER